MTFLAFVNVLLVIGAVIGMYYVAHRKKIGFVIFLGVEFSMGYIGYATENYGLIIAAVFYCCMNCYSWIKWSKMDRELEKHHEKL